MKRWIFGLILLLILGSMIVWRIGQKRADENMQRQQGGQRKHGSVTVSVAPVQLRDIVQTFVAAGSIEAPLSVKIAPKLTGRVEYIQLHEGDPVKKGQVLARIDPTEVQAEVRQSRAAVAEAEYRLAQAQLNENPANVSVSTQIRQQKAGATSARADFNQAEQNYEAQVASATAAVSDAESKVNSARAAINSVKANLDNANAKYNRIYGLYKQGFVSAQEVDDTKAAVSVQTAALEVAQSQLQSALAQKQSIMQNERIVRTKGKADIEASRARMVQAQASVEYANSNKAQNAAYKQSISALRAGVDAAKANLASAISRVSDTVLVSPLDGYVTGRYVDPGAVVTAGQQILVVQFMCQVWVTVAVPEEVTTKIHTGQPAQVQLDAYPGRTFVSRIVQINPSADPESRQFTVRVLLNNDQKLFRPGMFGRVTIVTDKVPNTTAVPKEAVKSNDKGTFVYTVDSEDKAHMLPVITGTSDAAWIAIQGLKPGIRVVTLSGMPLKDGQKISLGGERSKGGRRGQK